MPTSSKPKYEVRPVAPRMLRKVVSGKPMVSSILLAAAAAQLLKLRKEAAQKVFDKTFEGVELQVATTPRAARRCNPR